jgi:hypothetical protein
VEKYVQAIIHKSRLLKTKFYGLSNPARLSYIAGALLVCGILVTLVNSQGRENKNLFAQYVSPSWGCIGSCPSLPPSGPLSSGPSLSPFCPSPPVASPSAAPSGNAYYVAQNGGSDSNSCEQAKNPATAKQTINAGISCLKGGETLIVKSGTYNEVIKSNVPSGSAGSYTTIKSEVQYGAIIQPDMSWERQHAGIVAFSDSSNGFVTFDGFVVDGSKTTGLTNPVVIADGAHDIMILNNELKNAESVDSSSNSLGIAFGCTQGCVVRGNKIHDIGIGATASQHWFNYCIYFSGANNLVENNELYNCSGYAIHGYSSLGQSSNNILRNSELTP